MIVFEFVYCIVYLIYYILNSSFNFFCKELNLLKVTSDITVIGNDFLEHYLFCICFAYFLFSFAIKVIFKCSPECFIICYIICVNIAKEYLIFFSSNSKVVVTSTEFLLSGQCAGFFPNYIFRIIDWGEIFCVFFSWLNIKVTQKYHIVIT